PGGDDPRERGLALRPPALPPGDAAVPPLAPQRGRDRRELRGAPPRHRLAVRHLPPAGRTVASDVRDAKSPGARRLLGPARPAVPSFLGPGVGRRNRPR